MIGEWTNGPGPSLVSPSDKEKLDPCIMIVVWPWLHYYL